MLAIGTRVYGTYEIASIGYATKGEAYEDISQYRKGVDCTTYFDKEEEEWYVIEKK